MKFAKDRSVEYVSLDLDHYQANKTGMVLVSSGS